MAASVSFSTHLVDYFSSADGPADLLKGVQLGAHYATAFPLTREGRRVAEDVRGAASDAWSMLVWADVIAEGGRFCQKTDRLFRVYFYPSIASGIEGYVSRLAREALLQGVEFLNAVSEGASLLHSRKWVDLGRYAPVVNTLFEGSSIISDLVDARDQWNRLNLIQEIRPHLNSQEHIEFRRRAGYVTPSTPERVNADLERYRSSCDRHELFSLVRFVKDGLSITLSIAGLGIILTGAVVESSLFLTGFLLLLSTAFLLTKIFAHFYEKSVVDRLDPLPIGLIPERAAPAGNPPA